MLAVKSSKIARMSFIMSVCLSFRVEQFEIRWTEVRKIWYYFCVLKFFDVL